MSPPTANITPMPNTATLLVLLAAATYATLVIGLCIILAGRDQYERRNHVGPYRNRD